MHSISMPVSLDHSSVFLWLHFCHSPLLVSSHPLSPCLMAGCHQSEVGLQQCDGRSDSSSATRALVLLLCTSAVYSMARSILHLKNTNLQGEEPLYCMCSLVRGNKPSTSTGQARRHSVPHHCALHSMDVPNVLAHEIFHLSGRIIAFAVSQSMTNAALHLLFSASTNILSSLESSTQPWNIY